MKSIIVYTVAVVTFIAPLSWPEFVVQANLSGIPGSYLVAANSKRPATRKQVSKGRTRESSRREAPPTNYKRVAERVGSREVEQDIASVKTVYRAGRVHEASMRLFQMIRSPRYADHRDELRYYLGLTLFEMKLYQVSAFQFISVVREGSKRYSKSALEKLSVAADRLNDDTILNYALSKMKLEEFPAQHRNMLNFRMGEIQLKAKNFDKAVASFAAVSEQSEWYSKAKYLEGLANAERGRLNEALRSFNELLSVSSSKGVTHPNRVSAMIGMARVYYQMKQWDQAIEVYRQIPRDSELWHDHLFEISWAEMRAAQFRNVLSNFHSLHSAYYEDFYIPESLLLRGIVYLYICQYDEMDKTLDLFERIYKPVLSNLTQFLKSYSKPITYYEEIASQQDNLNELKTNTSSRNRFQIPFLIARHVIQEGDYSRVRTYIDQIRKEWAEVDKAPEGWKNSELGAYSKKILQGRMSGAKKLAGKYVRGHIIEIRKELADLFEQHGFARYEMLSGRKEQLKKRIAEKTIESKQLDEKQDRSFYVQNGYEYWPFSGEYWLDEIGNYHYLGTQKCD